jgi:hypothetical protein
VITLDRREEAQYRLIVFRPNGTEILVSEESSQFTLPIISIPRYTRPAERIANALNLLLNVQSYCLFTVSQELDSKSGSRFAVASTISEKAILPEGFRWLAAHRIAREARLDPPAASLLRQILEGSEVEHESAMGFFARPGWLDEIMTWAEQQLSPMGLHLTREFTQLNASPTFSLLRLETNGPAVWLKAVGQPNVQEFFISRELARLVPKFVPKVIGARDDCKAWLTLEAQGTHPDENASAVVWERIATTLARLEIASVGRTLHLIHAGFKDSRLCTLCDLVSPFIDFVGALMERQPLEPPKPMSRAELQELGEQMRRSLSDFDNLSLPNVVVHFDFNPGNIIVSDNGCVFLDWAEAAIGPCFLTLQYFREHIRQLKPRDSAAESRAISGYVTAWAPFLEPASIRGALSLSPFLAVTAYALSGSGWQGQKLRSEHPAASHLRSLARRIKREADALPERTTTCPS